MQFLATGAVDLDTDTFKLMLTTSTYSPNRDTHNFRDDVTNEVSGTGYSAGGVTLASVAVTYDTASDEVRIDWADAAWTTATFTTRYGVIYKSRGGASSADELVALLDFGGDQTVTGANFTIQFNANGVLYIDTT